MADRVVRRVTRFIVTALIAWVGCGRQGPETISVHGTVTLDGNPVAGASVMFMPQSAGRPATGLTGEEGRFELTTFRERDGAIPGQHRVTVTLSKTTGFLTDKDGLSAGVAPEGARQEWIVPQRYSNPDTSGLTVDVRDDMAPVRLELTTGVSAEKSLTQG